MYGFRCIGNANKIIKYSIKRTEVFKSRGRRRGVILLE
jgi:hypothetical protein